VNERGILDRRRRLALRAFTGLQISCYVH
jgi:hypothetical protein